MPRDERRRPPWRGALLVALCALILVAGGAIAVRQWRAAVALVTKAPVDDPGDRASEPPVAVLAGRTAREGGPVAHSTRRHRRERPPAKLGEMPLESLAAQLAAELAAVKPEVEACMRATGDGPDVGAGAAAAIHAVQESALRSSSEEAALSPEQEALLRNLESQAVAAGHAAAPRSLRLDIETGDGEARIAGVSPPHDDSAFFRCAERELRGRTVSSPGARAGSRVSVVLPF